MTTEVIAQLRAAGILREPAPGVLVDAAAPTTWRQQLYVASLTSNGVGVAGFRAAAALHRMDGYEEGPLEVIMPSPRRALMPGLTLHTGPLRPAHIDVVDMIRCTNVERTLCDLGAHDPEWRVRLAFEWAWRSGHELAVLQRFVDELHRPGQHGTKVLQELLVDARSRGRPTESALEVRLEAILDGIDGLVRQYTVDDEAGAFVARVDFAVPSAKVAIEAHSKQFHSGEQAAARDASRHRRLVAVGWRVRYVTSDEMKDPSVVRSSVRRLVATAREL